MRVLLAIALGACTTVNVLPGISFPDAGPMLDSAAARLDTAPAPDAGSVLRDSAAAPDATVIPPDTSTTCTLAPQSGCAPGYACRMSGPSGSRPRTTNPACELAGSQGENITINPQTCRSDVDDHDMCRAGMFCASGGCLMYCDPAIPCPPNWRGVRQRCDLDRYPGVGYCKTY